MRGIVGGGRIGTAWVTASQRVGIEVALISRASGDEVLAGPAGHPIVLCVRNDDLAVVLARIPDHRKTDLVFIQNGALRDFLAGRGLGESTRGILYALVAARGDGFTPGEPSPFCGPRATLVTEWLQAMGVPAVVVDQQRFALYEAEKLLWLSIFGVLCEAFTAPVDVIARDRRSEVDALAAELFAVCRAAMGVVAERDWLTERLCAYAAGLPGYRASVKEWPWRNGFLVDAARTHTVPTPLHEAWLKKIGRGPHR